jgi:LmbE family N-acetylglucosaminyl deacetylase
LSRSLRRFLLGLGAGALASYWLAQRALTPRYPDVALHAGLELTAAPRRVMAISPHPGDLEWFAAGTLFLLKQNRSTVITTLLTQGEKGGSVAQTGQIREREQAQAGAILGYDRIVQLGQPDGRLNAGELFPRIRSLYQEIRPDVIFTFDPEGLVPGWNNPDHVAAGAAVLSLIRAGIADGVRVYLYGTRRPNVTVDITEVLEKKEAAIWSHRSQMRGPDGLTKRAVRLYNRLGQGKSPAFFAEGFYRLV